MAIQTINLGTAPSGAGGDTFRSTGTKMNENFTNNTHAASRYVGTAAGNVMEVGAFGFGGTSNGIDPNVFDYKTRVISWAVPANLPAGLSNYSQGLQWCYGDKSYIWQLLATSQSSDFVFRTGNNGTWLSTYKMHHTGNTTVDSNGFIKKASPIIRLFTDEIEPNEEALEQEPVFEKVNAGHYLLKNTEGFSDDGWYIEMPKDANGNVLVAVQYQQLEDNTIEVKTFAKKFDEETGDILPNLEKPRDIPVGRWIDIRLKALPQPEIEISNTPIEFQPTNLAQAVAEVLRDDPE